MTVVGLCAGSTALNKVDFGRRKGGKKGNLFKNLVEVPRIEFKTCPPVEGLIPSDRQKGRSVLFTGLSIYFAKYASKRNQTEQRKKVEFLFFV